MTGVHDIAVDSLTVIRESRGELAIAEFRDLVPFPVARLFYVRDVPPGQARGGHAHFRCRQYMICQAGRIAVTLFDGQQQRSLELSPGQAILVEPGIFGTETYLDPDSALLVLCDRSYEKNDYIHDRDGVIKFRKGIG
jgi:UDP-2-acetamido-3-amino-2,3-dideoxy-glucuronate N-acetyltransferase